MRFVTLAHPATHGSISDILCAVRKSLFLGILFVAWSVFAFHRASAAVRQQTQTPPAPPVEASPPAQTPPASAPAPPNPAAPAPPVPAGPVIVIDPAHGGTDAGARGENAIEKDIALQLARSIRVALERQGYRVVMTRNDDSNPSYDDRDATVNAYRDAIFISVHVSSTGAAGTVRAYYMQFAAPVSPLPLAAAAAGPPARPPSPVALASWTEAQRPYVAASHRLADFVQGELAQAFSGSPPVSAAVPVRTLRSVTAPAVAIEISSVSTERPELLAASGEPLGAAIARAIAAFRQASIGGTR
jgi:N-acetylmuramoyl-L-alanine amidase